MGANTTIYTVQELVDLGTIEKPLDGNHGGIHPKSSDYVESGIPFVMASDLINGHVDTVNCKFISEEQAKTLRKGFAKEGDVLLSHKATIGRTAIVGKLDTEFVVLTPQVTYYRVKDQSKLNPQYLKYYFDSAAFQTLFEQWAGGGSTRLYLGITGQMKLPIELPDVNTQNLIVDVINSFDQKITLNRQINQTLEQMAQTLFKSWFVDFDPVIDNALEAGNPIPDELQHRAEVCKAVRESEGFKPLPDDVRQLFPDAFEESELGWMPKGWGSKNLTMLVDTISKTYPLKTVDEVIFLNTGDIEDGRFLHTDFSKVAGLPGQAKKSIQRNDILFSEIRPKNKRFAYVNFDAEHHVVSTKLMVLRAKQDVHPLFAYFLLTLEKTTNELQRIAELRSGTFPQITYTELGLISFSLPNDTKLIDAFVGLYLQPFYDKSFKSREENETLTKLRDTLLPKLISGELRLDDVEAAVEQETASA
ncbi:restriction endonuclease subunit S [Vibrio parahaemolyticus]|uniref:restriction endonuclease subunit S n=1 Tax=Vibrio parahaemolyticus TaxID=670 RepID=UPI0011216228|nr:restriction endonuclease subunit S [Vibrio parahaemolyticus]TOC26583.1 toxin [Vibrio parahaemolyticus]HCG6987467.1 restriction endonuclease subunit S [Vibrio parahaemolyticus]